MIRTMTVMLLMTAAPLAAQQPKASGAASQPARATVSRDSAQKIALARVPGGKVTEAELETEKGVLVWSFDVKVPGKSGVEEVWVDAKTGAVVATEHETPKDEAAERAKEKAAKKKP